VSADGVTWTTVFDSAVSGEYVETLAGKTHTFTQRSVRYVRDYLNGSTANSGNHWTEIEVWGTATTAYVGDYFEWNGSVETMTRYYSAGGTRVAVRNSNGNGTDGLVYLLGDHLGSTSLTADPLDGDKLSELRYKAWGETRHTLTNAPTDRRYTGQAEEAGIGLYYYGARFYDPLLGRFVSPDSIIPGTGNPLAWDRYAYTFNNPVKYNDPSGHCPFCLVAALVMGAIILTGDSPRVGAGEAANVTDLIIDGLQHEEHANIVGDGLQSLQDDPSVQAAQGRVVDVITGAPEYGKQAYSPSDISDQFVADGPSGNWMEAAINGNQAFWMVRGGTISATNTNVSADGTIATTWHVQDNFDFIPGPDRSADYNFWASIVHYFYNDLLGAEESFPTDAYWNESIPPQEKKSTPK